MLSIHSRSSLVVQPRSAIKDNISSHCEKTIILELSISINDFIDTFCVNTHKLNLFKKLISFLEFKNSVFKCQYFDLLIGGSYTDQTNTLPGDIDCAILLDKELISFFHVDCDPRENKDKELDIEFLDSNLSYKHYSTFVWITMLGNLPEISDKENVDCIMNNTFKKRNIYKVRFSMSSQT